jgi:hypothetical protein
MPEKGVNQINSLNLHRQKTSVFGPIFIVCVSPRYGCTADNFLLFERRPIRAALSVVFLVGYVLEI